METEFHRLLRERLEEVKRQRIENLTIGFSVDPADQIGIYYAREVGYVQALRDALAACDEVHKQLMGGR